jgi:hypothetical protein
MAGALALLGIGTIGAACEPLVDGVPREVPDTGAVPPATKSVESLEPRVWAPPEPRAADVPEGSGTVVVRRGDTYTFDPADIRTLRPDLFREPHISVFDVLAHLGETGQIDLTYHFDVGMDTHVIDQINGVAGWWYVAYYSNGWPEPNTFRMDHYPYKNRMTIQLQEVAQDELEPIYQSFRDETQRLEENGGKVIIPSLVIQSPAGDHVFEDVTVTPHDVRADVLQPGVPTALDALINLWEAGALPELKLTWYERIGSADPVDSYWVEQVDRAVADGGCGFVYEIGDRRFPGFSGSHIHIPSDVRIIRSPEYALWFWICL